MRGDDPQQAAMFCEIPPEEPLPEEHPSHRIRVMVEAVLKELSPQFNRLSSHTGRPSIAPEKLLRTQQLQVRYPMRREPLLQEHLDDNRQCRWCVGVQLDDPIWALDISQEP